MLARAVQRAETTQCAAAESCRDGDAAETCACVAVSDIADDAQFRSCEQSANRMSEFAALSYPSFLIAGQVATDPVEIRVQRVQFSVVCESRVEVAVGVSLDRRDRRERQQLAELRTLMRIASGVCKPALDPMARCSHRVAGVG